MILVAVHLQKMSSLQNC